MKTRVLILFLLISAQFLQAQKYEWTKYGLSFQPQVYYNFELSKEEGIDKEKVWRMYSDYLGVEVVAVPLKDQSEIFTSSVQNAAQEIARDMGYNPIKIGKALKGHDNFQGFYVSSRDKDYNGNKYPVVVAAIIDKKRNLSFEIAIDCYDGRLKTGLSFLKSIQYNPKE